MFKKLFWPILIFSSSLLTGILVWSRAANPLRPIVLFLFLLIIPGLSFTRLMHIREFLIELISAISLSLALSILMSEVMVFAHLWSPSVGLLILITLTSIGAVLQLKNILQQELSSTTGG